MSVDGDAGPHGSRHLVGDVLRVKESGHRVQDGIEDQRKRKGDEDDREREREDAKWEFEHQVDEAFPRHGLAQDFQQALPQRAPNRIRHRHRSDVRPEQVDRQLALDSREEQPGKEGDEQDRESDHHDHESRAGGEPADDDGEVQAAKRQRQEEIEDSEIGLPVARQAPRCTDHQGGSLGSTHRGFMSKQPHFDASLSHLGRVRR